MNSLIARNKLVGHCEARHDAALFEPEDGAERPAKEDSFYRRESEKACGEIRIRRVNPLERPFRLLLHTRNRLGRPKNIGLLLGVLNIRINEQRIRLGMHGLNEILNRVEMARLWPLDLASETSG